MNNYLLGNKIQQLIDRQKLNPHLINAVITRRRTRQENETENSKVENIKETKNPSNILPGREQLTAFDGEVVGAVGERAKVNPDTRTQRVI